MPTKTEIKAALRLARPVSVPDPRWRSDLDHDNYAFDNGRIVRRIDDEEISCADYRRAPRLDELDGDSYRGF